MNRRWLAYPYVVWMIAFILVPLFMIFYYGVTKDDGGQIVFTAEFIKKTFEPIYFNAMAKSFLYAGFATLICLVLAYPLALILAGKAGKSSAMLFIFILPMWMNFLLRTYAWLTLLETNNGVVNTLLRLLHLPSINILGTPNAIILGMVYNFLPFMVLPIYNTLVKIDPYILEAAHDLGADSFQRLIRVVFPLSLPGVMSGITMVFMPAVTSFVIPNLLGSGKVNLIGNLIEQQFLMTYNWGFGSAMSLILMIIILLAMGLMKRFDKGNLEGGAGRW
ncbi:MAG TPA: ABC transporter permease [Clostridia bacterium]|nr:ABC transporter permease [Clostridia bacterium]